MIAEEMRAQAAALQQQAESVQALEDAHRTWQQADRARTAAIDKALGQGVSVKVVAAAVEMPQSTVRSHHPQGEEIQPPASEERMVGTDG